MRRIFPLILLLIPLFYGCVHHDKNTTVKKRIADRYVDIEIPSEWIEKIRGYKYNKDTKTLINEFEGFLKPDTMINPNAELNDQGYRQLLDPLFVDLDGEQGVELISLIGWDIYNPYLCVFKQYSNTWHLIYIENVDKWGGTQLLNVANNFSQNKVFYYGYVSATGSGVYQDRYAFYKLISGKVYKCLDLLGSGLFVATERSMGEDMKMDFVFNGNDADEIHVNYNYRYSWTLPNEPQCYACVDEEIPLIQGSAGGSYVWDEKALKYVLNVRHNPATPNDRDVQKIAYFEEYSDNAMFAKAFKDQIDCILIKGTPQQKSEMKDYLKMVQKQRNSTTGR